MGLLSLIKRSTKRNPGRPSIADVAVPASSGMRVPFERLEVRRMFVAVGDYVFYDNDCDGIQDSGEAGVPGVVVEIRDASGNPVLNDKGVAGWPATTTDANGRYEFRSLPDGNYSLKFTKPSGYHFSPANQGTDDAKDSDVNAGGETPLIPLFAGKLPDNKTLADYRWDAGLCQDAPGIDLVKLTNSTDNNAPTGPVVPVGSTVTFTYVVSNTGNVPLSDISVLDDQNVTPVYQNGDIDGDGLLDVNETWTYSATATVVAGQYVNIGTASGKHGNTTVTDDDPDHHFGASPAINIVKLTNGTDNNVVTGPVVPVGSNVTFTYIVTNTGNVPLTSVSVVDDKGVTPLYQNGDADNDGALDLTETWTYAASTAAAAGQYVNIGTATGKDSTGATVTDSDVDHHFGATPAINLVKLTNGTDNNSPTGPVVPVGSTVTFTYIVTNTGNVPLAGISVVDDQGVTPVYVSGDADTDGNLDLTETWTFTAATIAVAGQYVNLGTVTGTDSTGTAVTDTDVDHHFGQAPANAKLGDRVWHDLDEDGVQDANEPGFAGVTVKLLNSGGTVVGTTTTDAAGLYCFDNLAAGTYSVQFITPAGYVLSDEDQGADDAIDSDADAITGVTGTYTLAAGDVNKTVDSGLFRKYAEGGGGHTPGFWHNKNGLKTMQDGGSIEPELAMLRALNLRNVDGSHFDPTTFEQFSKWLQQRDANNMAYQLSGQLAAMALNVEASDSGINGFVDEDAGVKANVLLPFAPIGGLNTANGTIAIGDLIIAANNALGADGYTPSGDTNRALQEALKDVLDKANNNANWL